jgi:indolepyruvate ferredoxin oxidoreductase
LLAPKDEYEVARLYAETDFLGRLGERFDGDVRLVFHLAPTWLAKPGPDGRPKKTSIGPWLLGALKWLAKARSIRGSWLDPFRFTPEKAIDRRLLAEYEADLDLIIGHPGAAPKAIDLASWPAEVRGFGPVRSQAAAQAGAARESARAALVA